MNSANPVILNGHSLTLEQLINVSRCGATVRLSEESVSLINRASGLIENWVANNRVVYGVTTGFGDLATVKVDAARTRLLQENLIRSHAVGVGAPLPEDA
ncbi:MAG: aromatic amino acid lyase, partial [Pyramidobacter sp.]|nr:aromatic amino acid lyase [Pyramidobacter sp.]